MPKGSKAALWNLAFYTGVRRGDVPTLYVFARVQLTRFRPVRGVLRTASTDSIVLHVVRRKRWHFKNNQLNLLSEVGWLRQFSIFHRHCEPVTDVTGVAIRIPRYIFSYPTAYKRLPRRTSAPRNDLRKS